jgi:hypothetical protein
MENRFITYKGKKYPVQEPTIESWSKLVALQEWTDEREFSMILISHITGLTKEEVEDTDWEDTVVASNTIAEYLTLGSKEFFNQFEFDGKTYKFIDLNNLKFGEFVDIDTFLTKPENERQREMNLLMALLYRELDDKGEMVPYDGKLTLERAEKFKKLPVKYFQGATSFFLRIEKILQGNIRLSFKVKVKMWMKITWMFVKAIVLIVFGVGSLLLSHLLKRILPKSKK